MSLITQKAPICLLRPELFFGLIWHLVLFGSEKAFLLTVKNLLIAPGGPGWLTAKIFSKAPESGASGR